MVLLQKEFVEEKVKVKKKKLSAQRVGRISQINKKLTMSVH